MDAAGLDPGQAFEFDDDRPQGVTVKRIAVQGLGVEHKPAACRLGRRRGDRHLAAEFIRRPRFAVADAFDFGGVQRIDLGAALAMVL